MAKKAAKLDRDTFGVDGAHGPWQQRLAEIGGIKPLAFGQFGVMGDGARPRSAPRQCGEAGAGGGQDGGSISDRKPRGRSRSAGVPRTAALGSRNPEGANTGPPWGAEVRSARVGRGRVRVASRDVRRTQRRSRPAAGHTLVGLVLEASTQAAGVPGTAATWGAPAGTRWIARSFDEDDAYSGGAMLRIR
jgi:hypothetical protein